MRPASNIAPVRISTRRSTARIPVSAWREDAQGIECKRTSSEAKRFAAKRRLYRAPDEERLAREQMGNPIRPGRDGTREEVIIQYRNWVCDQPQLIAALPELRRHDLVCWCAPEPCHVDVLIEMANR
jgi:hypothetical protein